MLAENNVFSISDAEKQLFDSRRSAPLCELTPEIIDYEMQSPHSAVELRLHHLTQSGLEHFAAKYAFSYKTLYLDDCSRIIDFSPLAGLANLEALLIEDCRRTGSLWDFSQNTSLKILSIRSAKAITAHPLRLQTSRTLEEVRLWGGSLDNKHTLESLSCFRGMKSLKRIDLNMIKLNTRNLDVLASLSQLEEFHFDAGMLTTEEIAWICAKYPHIYGDCLGAYTTHDISCPNDIRICGQRKPSLSLPKDQKRLEKYTSEFNALVEGYRTKP